ncbi:MAG: F0F1 ATP synthase subunit B' [Parvibaculales bacterium]
MPQLNPDFFAPQLVWLAITFIGLYVILSAFALPKLGGILAERRQRIEDDLAQAAQMRDEAEQALESYEAALAEARAKALAIAQEARQAANDAVAAQEMELETKLDAQLAEAEKRLAASRDQALGSVQDAAAGLVGDIVKAATGASVTKAAVEKALASGAGSVDKA